MTGGQAETLTTGFPSVYVGPHTGNNPFTNSLSSNVTGGYQSNPLLSTAFQNGILSPISARAVTLLVNSHPREAVFNLVLAGIEVSLPAGRHAFLRNDPLNDKPEQGGNCENIGARHGVRPLYPGGECSFSKFENLLKGLVLNGLYAELDPTSMPTSGSSFSTSSGGSSSSNSAGAPGKSASIMP